MDIPLHPSINASLNCIAAILLFAGWRAIKKGEREQHRKLMSAAFGVSTAFLISYLWYHYTSLHTPFPGTGLIKTVYLLILIPHIILATAMVPFIIAALWFAFKKQFDRHVKVTRFLWPVWMYVSVTGVIVYLMLYVLY